jgi:large subunit ribosomal protein L31
MKQGIHPKYYPQAKIICACGAVYNVGSTVEEVHIEVCAACHPFYTGKQKLVDTARRVEKYEERKKKGAEMKEAKKKKPKVEAVITEEQQTQ